MAVLIRRLVPGVRTLISLPAGINAMAVGRFVFYLAIGITIWCVILTYAGFTLAQNYGLVEQYLGPIAKHMLIALVIGGVFWIWPGRKTQATPK